ncbi:MAG TPA: protein-(glutamine-N5) methyltransferase, release factor-specific, partial [Xanthomonadaceae bacterium]|nr:protein-(glutamine-N5) methyltransferase, release factor-specific [Xanthomonadaceae bacterium]
MTAAPVSAHAVGMLLADETAAGLERHEAELLLLHVLGRERGWLFAHADAVPEPAQAEAFRALC